MISKQAAAELKLFALKYAASTLQRGDLAIERSTKRLEAAAVAYARSLGMVPEPTGCPLSGSFCTDHGFVHGEEAEELRAGIERIVAGKEECQDTRVPADVVATLFAALEDLLVSVDARDSLAWAEAATSSKRKARKGRSKR